MGDPCDIRNWQRRPDGITTSGKLGPGDPARLAAIGVRHVINLALDDHPETLAGEAELLAQLGIAYTHIPVPFDAPTVEHAAAMQNAIIEGKKPVHVHCIMNYRVSAFFYLLDRANGKTKAQSLEPMAQVWNPLKSNDPRAAPWRKLLT